MRWPAAMESLEALMSESDLDPQLMGELVALLEDHRFISAVKLYRERSGAGLGAAHAFVTQLNAEVVDPQADAAFVHRVE